MNLKLNNDVRNPRNIKSKTFTKEERQRTGRYIAILVGILLFLLAIYHAWVRRIPFIASLVVPAIIMFVYVGWVLYTASRDKHRALDAEAALAAELMAEMAAEEASHLAATNTDVSNVESQKNSAENLQQHLVEISAVITKGNFDENPTIVKPIILVNDEPPGDLENIYTQIGAKDILAITKINPLPVNRRFKRRFCRSKRHAVFKRSYSIA